MGDAIYIPRKGTGMVEIHIADIIPLIDIPSPPTGQSAYNIPCPCCDDGSHRKHLNINLQKDVFCCPRCKFSGGVFDLYAYYAGVDRSKVRKLLMERLNLKDDEAGYDHRKQKPRLTPSRPIMRSIELPLTDIDARHDTYTALLSKLTLASDHRENLLARGLTDEQIDILGYKTTPIAGCSVLAKQLQEEGYYLAGVPGFFHTKEGAWTLIHERRGILIPVKTIDGKIQGLQIRRDNTRKGKFRWVSSVGKQDGCKAECWAHISGTPAKTVLLTEGSMKGDVITFLTGLPVIAIPGVNSLTHLESLLATLKETGTEKVMTAFDMDYLQNPHVRDGYYNLTALLSKVGIEYGTYLWDPHYKGLDDYVWACKKAKQE